jgi:diaminohydroxyphosphoribosylaminopyrimidine deaminase/5-amino-6-(5-phosphoribosylamino)uracil reductase
MPTAKHYLDRAALLALRGAGDVEPNPLVGAIVVGADGRVIGMGHHRRFGGPHAEAEALADCRRRGESARGATVYVTLEPCNHAGKQPACSLALIDAGVARVVCARRDPNPVAAGGAEALRAAGIGVDFTNASPRATALTDSFAKRVTTGMPWIIAKWAQTIDGRIATRDGASKWISCEASRRRVHRLRARVDAIMAGIGTVRADDPRLTARGVPRLRRTARRVVIDPRVELPIESALVATIREAPLTLVFDESRRAAQSGRLRELESRGVEIIGAPAAAGVLDLRAALASLAAQHGLSTILVEAGPGLLGSLLRDDLIDEAHVYVAPLILGDEHALPPAAGLVAPAIADAKRFRLCAARRVADDVLLVYRRSGR